ncbi:Transmembrane transcriptional regulator (anti-sigma factor RsiW) [Epibacterium ulvae]|uniref:Transmembrane transcriptional regulator (Anti-sigma factor RsiW) n=1 Tax=Epibacterium ulvae TaxID=1156985 RepID=A0A1G5R6R3_9RHOB|nr:hypothetical protein [Epibacterium ulvae]SCZ69480.1 Transmembrane transcriptional regulator (anti-sigma factor RsiW) [Epibacterium ulvae]
MSSLENTQRFSDEDLTAYLDGEAGQDLANRIEAELETSQELRARLEALTLPIGDIRALWDSKLADAPPMPPLPQAAPRQAPVLPFGLGLAAGIVVMIAFQWNTTPPPPKWSEWQQSAAAYQALYMTETLAGFSPDTQEAQRQLDYIEERFELELASVTDAIGAEYRRSQVLGFEQRPLAQISLLTEDGVPLALCIIRRPVEPDKALRVGAIEGLAAAEWSRGEYSFLLVGGEDKEVVEELAQQFVETI